MHVVHNLTNQMVISWPKPFNFEKHIPEIQNVSIYGGLLVPKLH